MDLLTEVESLASIAALQDTRLPDAISETDISRWQMLFGFSREGALAEIKQFCEQSKYPPIALELWELQQEELQAEGHNRETYEYQLYQAVTRTPRSSHSSALTHSKTLEGSAMDEYIFKLSGPLLDTKTLEAVLGPCPDVKAGITDEGHRAFFCCVDAAERDAIEHWLNTLDGIQWPTFIRLSRARKKLSSTCIYPTLGKESTLPQYRLDSPDIRPMPSQNQYPVTYFFYGTLTDPTMLSQLLGVSVSTSRMLRGLQRASIQGGKVRIWGGKYKALVDASGVDTVQGFAFGIRTSTEEDASRHYETPYYEVVRCLIRLDGRGKVIKGLTFRFANAKALDEKDQ